ncbi:MAG TPA: hypothetical protein VK369_05960, partial [Segetibacter sp.]|nr:hypothetical protein [Segetibacter sp.]
LVYGAMSLPVIFDAAILLNDTFHLEIPFANLLIVLSENRLYRTLDKESKTIVIELNWRGKEE